MDDRRLYSLVAALLAAAIVAAGSLAGGGVASASASPRALSIVAPAHGSKVTGTVRYTVRTRARRYVGFFLDGRRRAVRRPLARGRARGPWRRRAIRLDTSSMRVGRHRLVAVQRGRRGRLRRDAHVIFVRRQRPARREAPAASPSPAPERAADEPVAPAPRPAGVAATWRATFEGPTLSEWSWFDRDDGGTFLAASAASQGIPSLGGAAVGHFGVSRADRADDTLHSKVYKNWAVGGLELDWRDDAGRPLERLPGGSPAGSYSAWYYLPEDYRADSEWANVFQFKESYVDSDGDWHQDPQWWVNITPAGSWGADERPAGVSGDAPVLAVSNWDGETEEPRQLLPAPRGRWFEIRAELHPGDRIDWYVDGRPWQSSSAARYPVGLSKRRATGWVFGVGHYGGLGRLWVDDAAFTAR